MALISTGVDSAAEELGKLQIQSACPEVLLQELRFLLKFVKCLSNFEQHDDVDVNLSSANETLKAVLKEAGHSFASETADSDEQKVLDSMAHRLLNQFEKFKPEIEKICALSLDSIKSKSCSSDEILNMVNCLVQNFKDISNLNADIVVSVKDQILVLAEKLILLRILVDFFSKRCTDQQILKDFMDYVKESVYDAVVWSLFGLLKGKNEIMAQGWRIMLSDLLLQKFMPPTPEMIIKLLKTSMLSRSDKFHVGEIVVGVVDFLLQVSPDALKDYVDTLKEDLIIMITFLIDPEDVAVINAGDELFTLVMSINEVLSLFSSVSIDKLSVDVPSLRGKIDKVKAEIKNLCLPSLNSSDFNFPKTNGMGFVNFFMEKLKDFVKYHLDEIAFAKYRLLTVHERLLFLEPFLKGIMELEKQSDLEELKELWRQIINLVFQADYVVSSCLIIDNPIWHDMFQLADVVDAIKIIEIELKNYDDRMDKKRLPNNMIDSSQVLTKQTKPTSAVVLGLEDDKKSIIDHLTRGTKKLQIVSIVGMGGIGKTTIAKKVYYDRSISYHFWKRAWCCISQVFNRKDLLFDLLTDVLGLNARQEYASLTDDDLADRLRKSLEQQRYLVILDDIWSIEAWDSIKDSLPNDNNGSRIIFTSRHHDLASLAKVDCYVHHLRLLSEDESWELLKLKLSNARNSPLDYNEAKVFKQIVRKCSGVPLMLLLVAGILQGKDIEFWKDIGNIMGIQSFTESYKDVIELSYNQLPDNLKPCFLYFGAFLEDRVVEAKKLMSLWVGEGLIPRDDKMSSYEIAEDYLSELVNRNLVILEERSSIGGIRACRVHDLLHDFCLMKAQEDNFLQRVHKGDGFHFSCDPRKYENYRLCIHTDWSDFVNDKASGRFVRSIFLIVDEARMKFPCPHDFLNSFRLLNVLDLECIEIDGAFPEELILMVNLRYLAIKSITGGKLPSSIAKLWNLEILIMNCGGDSLELPSTFWLMKNLRRVSIGEVYFDKSLEDNEYGPLEHLEIFSTPHSAYGNETTELLGRLPALRKFKFIYQFPCRSIAPYTFPKLSSLTQLESLHLKKSLYHEIGDWFPTLDFPSSLRKLILERIRLPWTAISIIGKLPNLEALKLRWSAFSGRRWNVEDGEFKALKFLELDRLDIEEWTVQDDPFPCLERLVVSCCIELGEIPSGLVNIPTLEKIEMRHCSSKAARSVMKILQEQREMENEILQVDVVD